MINRNNKKFIVIKLIDKTIFFGFLAFIRRKYLKILSNKSLKKCEYEINIHYSDRKNKLDLLCDLYGSDKGYYNISDRIFFNNWHPHTYTDVYSMLFDHCKENIENVFECGIGTNTNLISGMGDKYKPGASLRVWQDYFNNANIYGADIDKNILFNEDKIKTFYVDQLEKESIKSLWQKMEDIKFDLMVDDGLHTFEAGKTLFENSFHKLKDNGIYIIEDVSHLYLFKLANYFSKYNHCIIKLKSKRNNLLEDNNLIMIKKN